MTLADLMILVAASAGSFLLMREALRNPIVRTTRWWWVAVTVAGLVTWTPAALACSLRKPRPGLGRLSRRPGFVAILAAMTIWTCGALAIALLTLVRYARQSLRNDPQAWRVRQVPNEPAWWAGVILQVAGMAGGAVLASWVVLLVTGRRRPSRDWTDLLGRGIELLWVGLFLFEVCARLGSLRG